MGAAHKMDIILPRLARRELSATGFLALALISVAARGATGSDSSSPQAGTTQDSVGLEEIVVTARLRNESLMTVPDTVTVFSQADIDQFQLTRIDDFFLRTSNVKLIQEQDMA